MPAGGQEITGQQGSFGSPEHIQPLRSRKDGVGSANTALSGQGVSGQQGSLGKTRAKAVTGNSATASGGQLQDSVSVTTLPAWRTAMAANTRINLALNTQASVNPELSASLNPNFPGNAPWRGNTGYTNAFQYGALQYASELGQYGSIVGTIGGHNNYFGNEVVRFDIGSRSFAHLSDPYSSNSHPGQFFVRPNHGHADRNEGELHIDALFNTDPTQPCSFHPYASNVVIPPDTTTGAGHKGGLVTPVRAARYLDGVDSGNHSHRTHIFDLAQKTRSTAAWARYATNLYENGADRFSAGWAVYDSTRKKIFTGIRFNQSYNVLNVLNCVTRQWDTPLTLSAGVWQHTLGRAWHWEDNPDYIIIFVANYNTSPEYILQLVNVSTGQVSTPGTTGTGPSLGGGSDFVQSVNKIAHYEGGVGSPNRVWILTPPANFTASPWTWSFQDVTGPTPPIQTGGTTIPHIGRFVWAEKAKCFIWWANGTDTVQAWHVSGFEPPASGEALIVDEVSTEADVKLHPNVLWYGNMTDYASAAADWSFTTDYATMLLPGSTRPDGPKFEFYDVQGYGPSVRGVRWTTMSITPDTRFPGGNGQTIMEWRKWLNTATKGSSGGVAVGSVPRTELYNRAMYRIESDAIQGFNESGFKLGGFERHEQDQTYHVGHKSWHGPLINNQFYANTYWFGNKPGGGVYETAEGHGGQIFSLQNAFPMPFDTDVCIEQYLKLNTFTDSTPNPDGARRLWVNGVLAYEASNFVVIDELGPPPYEITKFMCQLFHGGTQAPLTPYHIRVWGYCIATRRIGPPKPV